MARTRRRHSYRKSRRWNPDAVPATAAAAPSKTNPRRRKGRTSRTMTRAAKRAHNRKLFRAKHKKSRKSRKPSSRARSSTRTSRARSSKRTSRARSRSNPAQFPAPYFSTMANPRRGKKRSSKGRARRNSPIKRKDARALKRVLRTHHYRCR